ncbi:gamma-glutamylcyclotransferase [Paenibacillus sp. 32352]|uniref:gamma-glutamylcyclotransferase family protein n=1 Tax=Paenibacillus sp. 32352 TaxID=1969111 RepID=UPI0009ADD70A|nr:gamma-glutamylcyclotransferase family protein [Paenibacillus sp. 32352]
MIWIFVYGTLLQGEINHEVAKPYVEQLEKGCVRGTLYNYGPYPGLVLAGGGSVEGEWLLVSEEGLVQLDGLEDYHGPGQLNDYERVWVHDALRPEREGWVYVWNDSRGCPPITDGSWRTRRKEA